jgi:hypothetical protein
MPVREVVKTERQNVSLSDFERELIALDGTAESINILCYGDSNVGKTVLAGTCPGRVLWLCGEPGYKSAARQGAKGHVRRIADTATALAAVDWLNYKRRYEKLSWLVLDGMSTMQDRFRLAYAAEAFDANPAKRAHRNLPDKPDYFNTQNFLKAWVPQLVDMPVNLLITAHAYRTDKTENGELLVFPGIQGKVTETANAISGLMDITAYFEKRRVRSKANPAESREVRRLWFANPTGRQRDADEIRYITGDKFGCMGPYMDSPTIPRMLAKINGEGV